MAIQLPRKPITRTLQLKPIQFSTLKDVKEPTLSELMAVLAAAHPTVGSRLDTQGITLADNSVIPTHCTFFNNYQDLGGDSCIFEIWTYEPGKIPQTLTPDPNSVNAIVDVVSASADGEGDTKEFIHISHVLVFGRAAIIECTKSTGGVNNIQRYLNKVGRGLNQGRKFSFFFTDAVSSNLGKEIERGGGAKGFTIGVTTVDPNSNSPLLGMLSSVRGYMPSSGLLTVDWKSKDKLSTAKVIAAYDEAIQQDEVESVIIHLNDSSSIRGLAKFKIKKTIEVADVGGKNPDLGELARKMVLYLDELCTPGDDGKRTLDEAGGLADNEVFIPDSRRSKKCKPSK